MANSEVNILGTDYEIVVKKYSDDEAFERRSIDGYCDHEPVETAKEAQKQTLRHEIVHAFFSESGLSDSGFSFEGAWCKNEELVDWIAWQGPKIHKAWEMANAT